jgi:lactaldehyde dehydrogenase
MMSEEQVNDAIEASDRAVEESNLSVYDRYDLLTAAADKLEERAE